MVHEHRLLPVKPGEEADFELAFAKAKTIIAGMRGFQRLVLSSALSRRTPTCCSWSGSDWRTTLRASAALRSTRSGGTWAASRLNAGLAAGVGLTGTAVKPSAADQPW